MSQSPPVAAGRVYLVVDDRVVAQCTGVTFGKSPEIVEEFGLDETDPAELAPGIQRVFGTMGLLRRVGDGGSEGLGLTAPRVLFVSRKYASMRLIDAGLKLTVFSLDRVTFGQEVWSLQARGIMSGTLAFKSTRSWRNERTGA